MTMNPDGTINILLVDDRPGALIALESALADLNQTLVKATSGREALKHVLKTNFAVILLDVHMPGIDGFETARLIRQRKSSRDTPIIFITGHTDELHIAKGYSLGAVDYILAPVRPDVLRAKVGVFVDLFQKTAQVTQQANRLRRRAGQLQELAAASIAINAAQSADRMLQTITDAARDVVGANQSITLFLGEQELGRNSPLAVSSFSEKYADWQGRRLDLAPVAQTLVARSGAATRMTEAQLHQHPDWEIVSKLDMPPMCGGMLAAPFTGHDGRNLGVIYLADAYEGQFTSEDEAILIQLAQIASTAIENILYAEAREANRLKDEFLATLSHELRTPLNAMLGWTRLLREPPTEPEMLDHGLQVIERNVNAQARLIEDLLDISRITSGKLRLEMQPMSLKSVVEAAIDAVKPAADARQIKVHDALPDDAMQMTGDANRLQQVMWNLLSNAIKFTPEAGSVYVEMEVKEGVGHIRIRDTGEGISPELLPHVFERFRQADSTSTRSHGGLGVGLAIVRHIVQMHDGSVEAESAGPNQGATFTVQLPLCYADAEVAEDDAEDKIVDQTLEGVRVLIVDDDCDARELLGQVIRRYHGTAKLVNSAHEALDLFEQWMPDILLSDIAMPDCDGYTLIRRIRASDAPQLRMLPAIALTAHAGERDRTRSLSAGFQVHMAKPVEPVELVAGIVRLLRLDRSATMNSVSVPLE
ncbi:response regulator [Phycisphaerales bacterium AB-hyl4]|uniref:histidine kinase n=1 Tax=Natronomicrosphaera hydrolytica TaxID=3242702 RepID=A0ABV4U9R8_9BACT